jgi:hypothetical protein
MKALIEALRKMLTVAICLPLGLLSAIGSVAGQSNAVPPPVRRQAKAISDLATARLVRRYAKALSTGHALPDLRRLPASARRFAERLDRAEAAQIARLSAERVLAEIERRPVPAEPQTPKAAPQPCPSALPAHVRKQMRARQREQRPAEALCPELTPDPEPVLLPRA